MQAQPEIAANAPARTTGQLPPAAKPIPNPRGTQTVPQPTPALARSPDGRFAPEFRPHPHPNKP
jgi:hypothetical protein